MPDEQLFCSIHYDTRDFSDNPLIFINLCLTILPSAMYSLPIQCDSHKGQVCVSSSVPKSDSPKGLEANNHSRGCQRCTLDWHQRRRQCVICDINPGRWIDVPAKTQWSFLFCSPLNVRLLQVFIQVGHDVFQKTTFCRLIALQLSLMPELELSSII